MRKMIGITVWLCLASAPLSSKAHGPSEEKGIFSKQLVQSQLRDSLMEVVGRYPGQIGIGLIVNGKDTIAVHNEAVYPMMSVFKLHQAIAVCERLEKCGRSLDSMATLRRNGLDPDTWSPMLKDHPEDTIRLPICSLLNFTLTLSDNNASNWLFENVCSPAYTDSLIATFIPRESFRIEYTEAEMKADHSRAFANRTSPIGAALLINRLFTDSLISQPKQEFIKRTLESCTTGQDRIVAPLGDKPGVKVGHKTGSGYRDRGLLAAHNDVAYIELPDGTTYSLAVFVTAFPGTEAEASAAIASISETAYRLLSKE